MKRMKRMKRIQRMNELHPHDAIWGSRNIGEKSSGSGEDVTPCVAGASCEHADRVSH